MLRLPSGTIYSNMFAGTSTSADQADTCYYTFDDDDRKPETAITVEELPDVVFQPEFRHELNKQFEVIYFIMNVDYCVKT